MPVGGADLAVLGNELEGLDESHDLLDRAADREIVDGDLPDLLLRVDDEETSQRDASLLDVDAVLLGEAVCVVCDQGQVEHANAALLPRRVDVGEVAVLGVAGRGEDFAVELAELLELVVEGDQLGRADEGEVHGVEEQDNPLALVLLEGDLLELALDDGLLLEGGSWLVDHARHCLSSLEGRCMCCTQRYGRKGKRVKRKNVNRKKKLNQNWV